jgi:hypothetical protein
MPSSGQKNPGSQVAQWVELFAYLPRGHASQFSDGSARGRTLPASQAAQAVAPDALNVPAPQFEHAAMTFKFLKVFGLHNAQPTAAAELSGDEGTVPSAQ